MKNVIIFLGSAMLGIIALSCKDKEVEAVEEQSSGIDIEIGVDIKLRNESGIDLLDPGNPNAWKNFKLYYIKDGAKVRYFDPLMSAPNGYRIDKYPFEPVYHLDVMLNTPRWDPANNGSWATTYLEFEDGSTDTINAQFYIAPNLLMIDRATYNGVPFFDRYLDYSHDPTYEVIK